MLSEKEIAEIKKGSPAGKGMIQDLFNIGKFALDGETYIPSCRPGDRSGPSRKTWNTHSEGRDRP